MTIWGGVRLGAARLGAVTLKARRLPSVAVGMVRLAPSYVAGGIANWSSPCNCCRSKALCSMGPLSREVEWRPWRLRSCCGDDCWGRPRLTGMDKEACGGDCCSSCWSCSICCCCCWSCCCWSCCCNCCCCCCNCCCCWSCGLNMVAGASGLPVLPVSCQNRIHTQTRLQFFIFPPISSTLAVQPSNRSTPFHSHLLPVSHSTLPGASRAHFPVLDSAVLSLNCVT